MSSRQATNDIGSRIAYILSDGNGNAENWWHEFGAVFEFTIEVIYDHVSGGHNVKSNHHE